MIHLFVHCRGLSAALANGTVQERMAAVCQTNKTQFLLNCVTAKKLTQMVGFGGYFLQGQPCKIKFMCKILLQKPYKTEFWILALKTNISNKYKKQTMKHVKEITQDCVKIEKHNR